MNTFWFPQESSATRITNDMSTYPPLEATHQRYSQRYHSLTAVQGPKSAYSSYNQPSCIDFLTDNEFKTCFNMYTHCNPNFPVHDANDQLINFLGARKAVLASSKQIKPRLVVSKIGRPKTSTMTSSERAKRFRAQRHQQVSKLVLDVGLLKCKVAQLAHAREQLKASCKDRRQTKVIYIVNKCLNSMNALGSSDQMVQQRYMKLFKEVCHENIEFTSLFTGKTYNGISKLLSSWAKYCKSFAKIEFSSHQINYSDLNGYVDATSMVKLQYSEKTFGIFFPTAIERTNGETFCGLEVLISIKHKLLFDEEGKCNSWKIEFDFVSGLAEALGSLERALNLLDHLNATNNC